MVRLIPITDVLRMFTYYIFAKNIFVFQTFPWLDFEQMLWEKIDSWLSIQMEKLQNVLRILP